MLRIQANSAVQQNHNYIPLYFVLLGIMSATPAFALDRKCPADIPDFPTVPHHMEQADITSGAVGFNRISDHGEKLFIAAFNTCDGSGRPATTGGGAKRDPLEQFTVAAGGVIGSNGEGPLVTAGQLTKIRTSAPDSDSCAGCHAQPRAGGAGDFVANVFVLAQARDPVTVSVDPGISNSRNTLGMNGSGPIEMLSREMTADLQSQASGLPDGNHVLSTHGVDFEITKSGGIVTASKGVDTDLIVKPFHQAGVVVSLREFSDNAFNHHHGMQAEERFDLNPAKGFETDYDEDGVQRELTVGDVTAATIWQAQLGVPGRLLPKNIDRQALVNEGEQLFDAIGCTSCHVPRMTLQSRLFVEPNPYNPAGTCSDLSVCPEYSYDMTRKGEGPLLEKGPGGTAIVRAYTDLKRHNLCDDPGPGAIRWFCNEQLAQGRPDQDGKPGSEFFLTRKLWDVGNSAPYGHRGDLSTIAEAILAHGGEARTARDTFEASTRRDQKAVVLFLKTLQVLPEGSANVVIAD